MPKVCSFFTEGNIVLNFLVEEGICKEDAECNRREDIKYYFFLKNSLNFVKS